MLLLCQRDAHDRPANLCRNLLHSTVSPEAHWYARQSRFAEHWPHSPEHPGEALDGSAGVRCAGTHRIRHALLRIRRNEVWWACAAHALVTRIWSTEVRSDHTVQ